jgi:hypothetical protein
MTLAMRINPAKHGYSPRMTAIVGAILGFDYGVRDGHGNQLTSLSITSDGFVIAGTDPVTSGAFLGDVRDLDRNINMFLADVKLTEDERKEWDAGYAVHVTDWRAAA